MYGKLKTFGLALLVCALPVAAYAEPYCMEVDPGRIALVGEGLVYTNEKRAENGLPAITQNEYISDSVRNQVRWDLQAEAVEDLQIDPNDINGDPFTVAEYYRQVAEAKKAVDERMGDW